MQSQRLRMNYNRRMVPFQWRAGKHHRNRETAPIAGQMQWEALLTFGSDLAKNVSLEFNHEETDKSRRWNILQPRYS